MEGEVADSSAGGLGGSASGSDRVLSNTSDQSPSPGHYPSHNPPPSHDPPSSHNLPPTHNPPSASPPIAPSPLQSASARDQLPANHTSQVPPQTKQDTLRHNESTQVKGNGKETTPGSSSGTAPTTRLKARPWRHIIFHRDTQEVVELQNLPIQDSTPTSQQGASALAKRVRATAQVDTANPRGVNSGTLKESVREGPSTVQKSTPASSSSRPPSTATPHAGVMTASRSSTSQPSSEGRQTFQSEGDKRKVEREARVDLSTSKKSEPTPSSSPLPPPPSAVGPCAGGVVDSVSNTAGPAGKEWQPVQSKKDKRKAKASGTTLGGRPRQSESRRGG